MKFKYVADEGEPKKARMYGLTFVAGQPQEVTDAAIIAKLKGHPCFVEHTGAIEAVEETDLAAEAADASVEEVHPLDKKAAKKRKAA